MAAAPIWLSGLSGAVSTLRLGLIGGNITASRSPALHIVCGLSVGRNVSYDLLIPAELRLSFPEVLAHCATSGFAGVNVTYPHKEQAAAQVEPGDPAVTAIGAANTVRFGKDGPRAFNTDYSGFIAAYQARFGGQAPGRVLLIGAGGVGRAVACGLAALRATELLIFDADPAKMSSLISALSGQSDLAVRSVESARLADLRGLDGVINCTPLGMDGREGSPLPTGVDGMPRWAFDAVYTPAETLFRAQTEALGAAFLSGYELYFQQGLRAFEIFSGQPVADPVWVRQVLNHHP